MRLKTQTLEVYVEETDAFCKVQTDADGSPFDLLTIDGVGKGVVTDANGVKSIDFGNTPEFQKNVSSLGAFFVPLLSFKTGATGSTANVIITGEDWLGRAMTESVLLGGADATIEATKLFRKVTSFAPDADYTNVSVGVKAEVDQFGPWLTFDTYANPFSVFLDLREPTNGGTLTIELSNDPALMDSSDGVALDPNAIEVFNAVAPFAPAITDAVVGKLTSQVGIAGQDVNLPFLAARLRHTAGTAGKWSARFQQSGGGPGR